VKLLVDAQLPWRLAELLTATGHDVVHTSQLALANRTTDQTILQVARDEQRIVLSKDRDFVDSHLRSGEPAQLLWVTTGNIANNELLAVFTANLPAIEQSFREATFLELSVTSLLIHH